ncbi:hypothetical protein BDV96DRAFT_603056 [Lophiotrema nucula]|uniref:Uncharacterized protein n=1 Tax=Lophiotrema nucula TaxID=690887 RepID=A0A6A5YWF5_9PLEO|nr:hypothetical protein BDV96DRAFT_603056 [Lophiotrema nucula]
MSTTRLFHGAHATFGAGCTISALQLQNPVHITDHVSVKTNITSILLEVNYSGTQRLPDLAEFGVLKYTSTLRKLHNGSTMRTLFAVYKQPEHALAAVQRPSSAKLRYRVFFTARTDIVVRVRHKIDELKNKWPDMDFAWKNHESQMRTDLLVVGTQREDVASVKALIEEILAGSTTVRSDRYKLQIRTQPVTEL